MGNEQKKKKRKERNEDTIHRFPSNIASNSDECVKNNEEDEGAESGTNVEKIERKKNKRRKHINKLLGSKISISMVALSLPLYTCFDAYATLASFCLFIQYNIFIVSLAIYPHETNSIEHHTHSHTWYYSSTNTTSHSVAWHGITGTCILFHSFSSCFVVVIFCSSMRNSCWTAHIHRRNAPMDPNEWQRECTSLNVKYIRYREKEEWIEIMRRKQIWTFFVPFQCCI